ncbi:MAG: hypothetical protein LUG62_11040, partial [Clostridiales bacterium]|nr:hypothetical protein [Clostridiales bacterium]
MKKGRITAVVLTVLMVLSTLSSAVFAQSAPAGALGGKLKISGYAAVNATLSADYTEAEPSGLGDDYVTFSWVREGTVVDENGMETAIAAEVGTDRTYTVTQEDLGYVITLTVTGREDLGVTGTLYVSTLPVAATEEEAAALAGQYGEDTPYSEEAYEIYEEDSEPEEEDYSYGEELYQEDSYDGDSCEEEDLNEEDSYWEYSDEEAGAESLYGAETGTEGAAEEEPAADEGDWEVYDADELTAANGSLESAIAEADSEAAEESLSVAAENGESEEEAETVYTAEATAADGTESLDFGTVSEDYAESVEALYIVVTNTGTGSLNFETVSPSYFMVEDITEEPLPGESVTLWVIPREGLEEGTYEETITYTAYEGAAASVVACVTVEAASEEESGSESGEAGNEEVIEVTATPEPTETPEPTATPEPT